MKRRTSIKLTAAMAAAIAIAYAAVASASGVAVQAKPSLAIGNALTCGNMNPVTGSSNIEKLLAYEPLVIRDQNRKTYPGLATSWKVTPYKNRSNKVITLELRRGVRFSDGTPFDADAVKTYVEWRKKSATQYSSAMVNPEVTVLGKYRVRFRVQTPNPDLALALAVDWGTIASPKAIEASVADPKNDFLASRTAGAGQYVVVPSQSVTGDHCTLVPNKYYYDKSKVKWGKIVMKTIKDPNTMLAALQTGQIDVGLNPGASIRQAAQRAKLRIVRSSGPVLGMLIMDRGGVLFKALGDVRVRQAINYAVNRQRMATGLGGAGTKTTSNEDQSRALPAKWDQYYTYNPTKAKQLLAQAGYSNGFELKMFVRGPSFGASLSEVPEQAAFTQDMAAVGIKVTADQIDTGPALGAAIRNKSYAGWLATIGLQSTAQFYTALLAKGAFSTDPRDEWHDPVLDRLYYKAIAAPTAAKAEDLWQQIDQRAISQAYFVPIYRRPVLHYVNKRVGGVVGGLDAYSPSDPTTWFPTGK